MAHLIDALLRLARLGRSELNRTSVDLSGLARESFERIRQADPGRSCELLVADGAVAQGDVRLLGVVLDNLLGNAWKFTARREVSRIEFGRKDQGGKQAYFVRDNGAGFDMAYAAKLFGAFQRLHTSQEFEGTGIGLATVARIIHRHGGAVWAEGEVDQGAVFYFTIGQIPTTTT